MVDKDDFYPPQKPREPETWMSQHRPKGHPQPRENKSQKAQLDTAHQEGKPGP